MFNDICFSSDETDGDAVKEGNNLVPPSGSSSTSQDVESSPASASANDSTSLPSSESAPTTPQASPSSVPADGTDPLARRMGEYFLHSSIFLNVSASCNFYTASNPH
jgi:hypothetical protein